MSDLPTFRAGARVEVLVSTGFGLITGRITNQYDGWLVLDPTSEQARKVPGHHQRPVKWIQMIHVVTIAETEEQ